jgi:phage terminase large subunit
MSFGAIGSAAKAALAPKSIGIAIMMMRVEAARRVFPRCWFNDSTTEAGRDALGYFIGFGLPLNAGFINN